MTDLTDTLSPAASGPAATEPATAGDATTIGREIDGSSPADAIRLLVGEVRAAAASEMELAKACGAIVGASAKSISIWGVVALITLFVAVLTLAIGLMIALATITGPWLAALIVPGVLLCITAIAGLCIRSAAMRAKAAVARLSS